MTPKEKAKELVNKYYNKIEHTISNEYESITKEITKECALIAVDEIIEATNMYQYGISNALEHIPSKIVKHPYWQEVKQEIENL